MTLNELINELLELKDRSFGETKIMKHIPVLYTQDGVIYENMYRMKDEDFEFDSHNYTGNGSDYECITLPYGCHETCSIEEYNNDREEWEKDLEDISEADKDDDDFPTDECCSTDED